MGEKLARFSLRADAIYCIGLGAVLASQRRELAERTNFPPDVLAGAGVGAVVWGLIVSRLAGASSWRGATRFVGLANLSAVGALVWFGNIRGGSARRWVSGLIGQVGGFALSQFIALAAGRATSDQ